MNGKKVSFSTAKRLVGDININRPKFKKGIISDIKRSNISKTNKKRLLKTARAIKSDSWRWNKSWDKGHIFSMKKAKRKTKTTKRRARYIWD